MKRTLLALCSLSVAGLTGCSKAEVASAAQAGSEAPPVPENGYQLQFGPFDVPPGAEVQLCRTMKLPNDEPVAVNRLQVVMNHGSHHLILFRSNQDLPDQVFPCWGTVNFEDWGFMMDVNKSGGYDWPLAPGQAFLIQPHQQIMIQSHFVNATTVQSPDGAMTYINLYKTPMDEMKHEIKGMFTVNSRLYIPPHSVYTTTRRCRFSRTANLVAMTGHFHARGTDFSVHKFQDPETGADNATEFDMGQIYDSTSWDSPVFEIFDSPLEIAPPQGLRFNCSYMNNTDNLIGFGGHADVQEHCNLFFQYYDTFDDDTLGDLRCQEGSGGW